jgi:hypothetical protein
MGTRECRNMVGSPSPHNPLFLTTIVPSLATLAQIILFLKILKFSIPPFFFKEHFFMKEKEKIFLKYFWVFYFRN